MKFKLIASVLILFLANCLFRLISAVLSPCLHFVSVEELDVEMCKLSHISNHYILSYSCNFFFYFIFLLYEMIKLFQPLV